MGLGEPRRSGFPGAMGDGPQRALGYATADQARKRPWRAAVARRRGFACRNRSTIRGTWAALALLVGLGSVSLAVFSGGGITWAHIVVPALLCVAGTVFALWQILLVVVAARRTGRRIVFAAVGGHRRDHGRAGRRRWSATARCRR